MFDDIVVENHRIDSDKTTPIPVKTASEIICHDLIVLIGNASKFR